jgi:hypothetical protein
MHRRSTGERCEVLIGRKDWSTRHVGWRHALLHVSTLHKVRRRDLHIPYIPLELALEFAVHRGLGTS